MLGQVPCDEAAFSIKKKNRIFRGLVLNVPVGVIGVGNKPLKLQLRYPALPLASQFELNYLCLTT